MIRFVTNWKFLILCVISLAMWYFYAPSRGSSTTKISLAPIHEGDLLFLLGMEGQKIKFEVPGEPSLVDVEVGCQQKNADLMRLGGFSFSRRDIDHISINTVTVFVAFKPINGTISIADELEWHCRSSTGNGTAGNSSKIRNPFKGSQSYGNFLHQEGDEVFFFQATSPEAEVLARLFVKVIPTYGDPGKRNTSNEN